MPARGAVGGDVFVVGSIGFVVTVVSIFIFMPIFQMMANALITQEGSYSLATFLGKLFSERLWGIGCVTGGVRCGVAWNSLFLAVLVGALTTLIGLVFALVVSRTGFRYGRILRALTVLPIITPPFVIGLAIVLLFGLSGAVTQAFAGLFDMQPTRWVYGLPGLLIAQLLAFTPIAFLVLIGVVEGVSPSMEEAAQTLRASRWQTFRTVSLPLMRPGLANAFLLGFIESMADFGNPLVLGGNFDVLSTEIFFAVVGAQNDQAQAAILSLVLLVFTLGAFYAQRFWLGDKSYTTVSGKGDAGMHPTAAAPPAMGSVLRIAGFWVALTLLRLCDHILRQLRQAVGRRLQPHLQPLREGLRGRLERVRHPLEGIGLELVLDDDHHRAGLGAAHRDDRAAHRLSAGAPGFPRQARLRVRDHAVLRHPRHGHRRQLCHRLQRAADRAHRHRRHPGAVVHLPQHAGRRAGRRRLDVADRSQPR